MRMLALAKLRSRIRLRSRPALDCGLALLLLVGTHAIYSSARGVVQLCDSRYSIFAAEVLLKEGAFDLRRHIPADASNLSGYDAGTGLPYQFVRPHGTGRVHYGYPLGSAALSLPWVAYHCVYKHRTTMDLEGVPLDQAEGLLQLRIASQVTALIAVLFFVLARFYLRPVPAALLAAGFAFGSPLFSTMARSLWSHTWMAFWITAAIILLVGLKRMKEPTWKSDLLFGIGMGTSLFWAAFCRQDAVFSAFAIGVYLLLHHRRALAFTVVFGGIWTAGLVAFSLATFGTIQPPSVYSPGMLDGRDVANRFAWLMVSPTRGLLVYCPYLVVILAILFGARRHLADAGLLVPAGVVFASHTWMIASFSGWHANSAYGPRYYCDLTPWFALLAAMGAAAIPELPRFRGLLVGLLAAGFAWGIFVHARGANSEDAWFWNHYPRSVGNEASVKDWRHPQFLAGLTFRVERDGTITE